MLKTYIVHFLDYLKFTLRAGKHTKPIALSKYFILFFFSVFRSPVFLQVTMSLRKRNQMWVTTRNKRFKMVVLALSYISECHSDIFFRDLATENIYIHIFFSDIFR